MEFLTQENALVIIAALLALSEAMALIPKVKANSVFQLIVNILKGIAKK